MVAPNPLAAIYIDHDPPPFPRYPLLCSPLCSPHRSRRIVECERLTSLLVRYYLLYRYDNIFNGKGPMQLATSSLPVDGFASLL